MEKEAQAKPVEILDQSGRVLYSLDKDKRKIEYFIRDYKTGDIKTKISIDGFDKLPSGFKTKTGGIPSSGYILLNKINDKYRTVTICIHRDQKSAQKKIKGIRKLIINHTDLRLLLKKLRGIKSDSYQAQVAAVDVFLNELFPRIFKLKTKPDNLYKGNSINELLRKRKVLDKLSADDVIELAKFFPKFVKIHSDSLKGSEKLIQLSKTKTAAEIIYIENIINEYERRLTGKTQDENEWQKFLSKYILIFNSNYTTVLEKESIALSGKYPDFLLMDAYNYLDIYEIKKPNTNLLKEDKSRKNYYWDTELAKAISQVENYIHYANTNSATLVQEIKRNKEIDIKVVKPRGIIIAGTRQQFTSRVMEDNFRILNNSLKNIQIILYDELLNSLKNFLKKLKGKK